MSGNSLDAIDAPEPRRNPRRSPQELARAVESGRQVAAALRYLDTYGGEPGAPVVAEALARFLVGRCESSHAGWRALRRVVVDSAADAPWEKCARRAVPDVADDLITLAEEGGRTPLSRAQHVAAQRRAEEIAPHVDPRAVLSGLGLPVRPVEAEAWRAALVAAVSAKSREQVARAVDESLREQPAQEGEAVDGDGVL